MQRTPLYDEYAAHGAKVVDFHGWALPVQFAGIVEEHLHTRTKAGLFDCSHMGEFLLRGEAAIQSFDRLVIGDICGLKTGRCRYTAILNDDGGIVDDCVALRLAEDEVYVVTNAGPLERAAALICAAPGAQNLSDATAKIDVQGPLSREVLLSAGLDAVAPLKYWTGARAFWLGKEILVTRAGYTGELGYELFLPIDLASTAWRTLLAHPDTAPCGLGARDTLRTEMGYALYGEDVDESTTPIEARLDRFIDWHTEFPGKAKIEALRDRGGYRVLTAIKSQSRRAPRHGFEVKRDGAVAGVVTSGTFGPSVGCGVGLAMLEPDCAAPGMVLTAGPKEMEIVAAESPVYWGGTCRMKVE